MIAMPSEHVRFALELVWDHCPHRANSGGAVGKARAVQVVLSGPRNHMYTGPR